MSHPVKKPTPSSMSASGAAATRGIVTGIVNNVAQVRLDPGNKTINVRVDMMRAKGVSPKAGESWLFDQPFGNGWWFACPLSYPGLDKAVTWSTPTLLGAWVDFSAPGTWTPGSALYSPAGYYREESGWVSLRGTVKSGTVTNSSAAGPISADVFQLPAGCRLGTHGQQIFQTYGSAACAVLVMPDGYVRAYAGSNAQFSLDGVRFLAEQ